MSTPSNRRRDPGRFGGESIGLLVFVVSTLVLGGGAYAAVRLGHAIEQTGEALPSDPFEVVIGLFTGAVEWPRTATWIVVGIVAMLTAAIVAIGIGVARSRRTASRVDPAAAKMGIGLDLEPLSKRAVAATGARLGVDCAQPGVPIGRAVRGGQELYGSWEDMLLLIAGPRTMKTTAYAVPVILDAPGAVFVTSNKRDVVDATRDVRAGSGPVWVFDPQAIVGEEPSWWWNPLSYVTDEVKAAKLAEHFAAGAQKEGARTDPHFEENGQDLLAGALLAAALSGRPIVDVYTWLTRPADTTPAEILRQHEYWLIADQFEGMANAPDKERGSIFSTARRMASCLTVSSVHPWVMARNGGYDSRREFDPAAFARSEGTLYSLSKEGRGTAGPLVTALTVAVVEAAEELAVCSPKGRLPVPILGILDEAANVCRWRELPNLYSHYGSRGIVLLTILQSWSQGVDVWGESGMNKLFSAANIFVYGGGVREERFLESLSKIIGDYDHEAASTSTGRKQHTVSRQLVRHRILDVHDLAALPKGRAVVLASGARPTMIRTQPWMSGPHAEAVRASIAAHDPQAEKTLLQAASDLSEIAAQEVLR